MSKIGKLPIKILEGVKVDFKNDVLTVTGPKGTLLCDVNKNVGLEIKTDTNEIILKPLKEGREYFAIWGTQRALINNCIIGVTTGFEKRLIIEGIGYKAEVKGKDIILNIGYSHQVPIAIPEDLTITVDKTNIIIQGNSKKSVGDFAALLRIQRKTNPYSMKGIRYNDERVIKKSGKKAG